MANILLTPIGHQLYQGIYRHPDGGWIIPTLIVQDEPDMVSGYQALNHDREYQQNLLAYLLFDLKECWLYQEPEFIKLTRYLELDTSSDKRQVRIRRGKKGPVVTSQDRNIMLKFVEDNLATTRLIEKVILQTIALTGLNWYDIVSNKEYIRDKIAHEIRSLLEDVMYKSSEV